MNVVVTGGRRELWPALDWFSRDAKIRYDATGLTLAEALRIPLPRLATVYGMLRFRYRLNVLHRRLSRRFLFQALDQRAHVVIPSE